jgi:hypothetical protein
LNNQVFTSYKAQCLKPGAFKIWVSWIRQWVSPTESSTRVCGVDGSKFAT